jgi:hypothetical protein
MSSGILERIGGSLQKRVFANRNLLSTDDIDSLKKELQNRRYSLTAAQGLSENSEKIIAQVVDFLNPNLSHDEVGQFKEFIDLFIRAISYALVAEDKAPIDEYVLNGFHEFVHATNQSMKNYIDALKYIKSNVRLQGGSRQKLDEYVQYTIDALSSKGV